MLTQVTTTLRARAAHAKTYLFNSNRITDIFERGEYAVGTVVITAFAKLIDGDACDTLEIAGVTFTFQAGASGAGTAQVRAATSNTATATDLAAQINGYTAAGALAVNRVTAVASGVNVTITADNYGTAANAYTLVYTDLGGATPGIGLTVSGATLLGGEASTSVFWYNEIIGDRRDKAEEYTASTTYAQLKAAIDSSTIPDVRIELTTTERNDEAFVKTLNVNVDDIVKVAYFDADETLLWLARGAFKIDKYRVTHTQAEILALQNVVYKRGVAGTNVAATEYGDGDYHKTVLTLTDWTLTVTLASLGIGAKIYDMPEGYITPLHGILDLLISSDTNTDTPDTGIGDVIASGAVAILGGTATFESILDGFAATAITPVGSATTKQFNAEADNNPYDGHTTPMDIFLNVADAWGAAGDIVFNGTIVLYWKYVGDL